MKNLVWVLILSLIMILSNCGAPYRPSDAGEPKMSPKTFEKDKPSKKKAPSYSEDSDMSAGSKT